MDIKALTTVSIHFLSGMGGGTTSSPFRTAVLGKNEKNLFNSIMSRLNLNRTLKNMLLCWRLRIRMDPFNLRNIGGSGCYCIN